MVRNYKLSLFDPIVLLRLPAVPDFTLSDTLWSVRNRDPSSSSEKWKMESNRKQRFRFETRDGRRVLRKTRAKIDGLNWLPPRTR